MSIVIGGTTSYVTSGLALYLDAGRTSSYPGAGSIWYDLSPNANHATLNNVTYSENKMIFNGSTSYANVGSTGLTSFTSGLTVSVFANMYPSSGSYSRFIDFGGGQGVDNIGFCKYSSSPIAFPFYYTAGAAQTQLNLNVANTLYYNQNMMYTYTADGTTLRLYINGTLVGSGAASGFPNTGTRSLNYIGRSNWADPYYYGSISAVQIYNRALSQAEIQQNYAYVSQGITYSDGSTRATGKVLDTGGLINIKSYQGVGTFTWTKPVGCTTVLVKVIGGGGGACGYCESGGAGGYAEKVIDLTGVNTVTVTVGGGGASVAYYAAAGNGGTSSFGSYCSATGGYGANQNSSHSGGIGGIGSGGTVNLYGGTGTGHANTSGHWPGGLGGATYLGGSGTVSRPGVTTKLYSGSPGSGGPGSRTNDGAGGAGVSNGETGAVIVYAYA